MEIGLDSFAAILPDPATGKLPSATNRVADLLEEVEVADRVGLDVFGMGEHHRAESWILRQRSSWRLRLLARKESDSQAQLRS